MNTLLILDGIVLPTGHRDLIDLNVLKGEEKAPVVIEADKENNDEDNN